MRWRAGKCEDQSAISCVTLFVLVCFVFMALGMELGAWQMLVKCSTPELPPQPFYVTHFTSLSLKSRLMGTTTLLRQLRVAVEVT